jgi:hypothetical protein
MSGSPHLPVLEEAATGSRPDRVYLRLERHGRHALWGMEYGGLRCEVVEPFVDVRGRAGEGGAAVAGIERDLLRGVGL